MNECKCDKPLLQPLTKQCGKCKMYIDRVRHIILTNQKKMSKLISPCCNEELILVASIDTRRLYKCSKCKNYTKPKQR